MARTTKVVSFSVEPKLAADFEKMARKAGKPKSLFFREMVAAYRASSWKEKWAGFQAYGAGKAREARVFTEKDIDRLVFRDR
jgi:hypothetical protein